jgi:hypothetical protein
MAVLVCEMLTKSETFGMGNIIENKSVNSMDLPYVQVYFPTFLISLTRYNPESWPTALRTLTSELDMLHMGDEDENSMFVADLMLVRIGGVGFDSLMRFVSSKYFDTRSEEILARILRLGMWVLDRRGVNNEYQRLKSELNQLTNSQWLNTEEYRRTQTLPSIRAMSEAVFSLPKKCE